MLQNVQQERVQGYKALFLTGAIGVGEDVQFVVHVWVVWDRLPFYSSVGFISPRRSRPKAVGQERYYPLLGIGNFMSATRFCRTCDEFHHYVRPRSTMGETVSQAQQRWIFCERFVALHVLMEAAS